MSSRFIVITLAAVATLAGCALPPVGGAVVRCAVGDVCPDELRCVQGPDGGTCRPADAACVVDVDGVPTEAANGTVCSAGICVGGACVAPLCGDGIVSGEETCDGNVDGCREDCTRCGDGVRDAALGEACDDGDDNSDVLAGACRTTCVAAACGDGVIDPAETCDGDDGCRADCSSCGDGVVDDAAGEICDFGDDNSDTAAGSCRTSCVPSSCGDGVIDPGEACDEGVRNSDADPDSCRTACTRARCGDGVKDTDEACDVADPVNGERCRGDCQKIEVCGDGEVDDGEACDDRNDNPRDGCDGCRRTRWDVEVVARGRTLGDALALTGPLGVGIDVTGAVYIADTGGNRVLRQDANGTTVFAGTGSAGFSGDGGQAIAAELRGPTDVVVAGNGDVFIADRLNDRIRSVNPNGVIRTIVGGGSPVLGDGDGGDGVLARLRRPRGVALQGNRLLIAEEDGGRVRQTNLNGNNVVTIVGGEAVDALLEDGGALTTGRLLVPLDVAPVGADDFVVAEGGRGLVRLVKPLTSTIVTIAGGGSTAPPKASVDVDARTIAFGIPTGLVADGDKTVFVTDASLRRIFSIDISGATPLLRPLAGSGNAGVLGDGELLDVDLGRPAGITGVPGRLYVADEAQHVVREVGTQRVTTIAGTGAPGVDAEGALATTVTLVEPIAVAPDGSGGVYIADPGARRVYLRSPEGHLRTVAGTGDGGGPEVGGLATQQPITPSSIVARANGTLVMSAADNKLGGAVFEVDPGTGVVSQLATLEPFEFGQQGISIEALPLAIDELGRVVIAGPGFVAVEEPGDLSVLPGFTVFFLDSEAPSAVASVSATEVAIGGSGTLLRATLDFATATNTAVSVEVAKGSLRGLLVVNGVVLMASRKGIDRITVAGIEPVIVAAAERAGDGVVIGASSVVSPAGLALDEDGSLLIADPGAGLVRRADPLGVGLVETIAGDLHPAGPGPLPEAALYSPQQIVLVPDGSLLVGGATGRLLQVVFGVEGRVDVVVGHPFGPRRNDGLARFAPLLASTTLLVPGPGADRVQLLSNNLRHEIDLTPSPSSWLLAPQPSAEVSVSTSGLTTGIVLSDGRIAVSSRALDCVHIHPLRSPPETLFGTCTFEGSFDGLVRNPGGLAVSPTSGAIYLADTGNNRVLRRDVDGSVSVVIGDGSPSSAGQGGPAREFPLQAPAHVAIDRFGNLFVSSTTTVRMVANVNGNDDADGDDVVFTIFGGGSRASFPENESRCLAGLALDDRLGRVYVADACSSFLVALSPVFLP